MRIRSVLDIIFLAAGVAGLALAVWVGVGQGAALPLPWSFGLSPAAAALGSLGLGWAHLLGTPGYKRLPFWVAALGGSLVAVLAFRPFGYGVPVQPGVLFATGWVGLAAARVAMGVTMLGTRPFLLVAALVAAVMAGAGAAVSGPPSKADLAAFADDGSFARLLKMVHPARRADEEVRKFITELLSDKTLDSKKQQERIRELNERVESLEKDLERFRRTQGERDAYRDEVALLRRRLEEAARGRVRPEDIVPVATYAEAVRPLSPIVRDFAVSLAGRYPGAFDEGAAGKQVPGETGLKQVLHIHKSVFAAWKYVSDPLFAGKEYRSPADRTISAGLAGDCDDFAILVASLVEAVGGRARILHGLCPDGSGHAWAEVHVGNLSALTRAQRLVRGWYPDRRPSHVAPSDENDYWLSLDWEVGALLCNRILEVVYATR